MESNILYFSKTSEFFLHMVDSIERAAQDIGIDLYRERRFRDKVVFFLGSNGNPYPVSFKVRERPNNTHMDIIGTFTIGVFDSDEMYTFGVHTRDGEYGSSINITAHQHLTWEIFAEIRNKEQVQAHFLRILRAFSQKVDKIHKEWSRYASAKKRAKHLCRPVQKQALE